MEATEPISTGQFEADDATSLSRGLNVGGSQRNLLPCPRIPRGPKDGSKESTSTLTQRNFN